MACEEDGIIDTIKSIFQGNAAKSKKRAAAIVEKKKSSNMEASNATENVTDVSNASNGSNVTDHLKEVHERLVVDRRSLDEARNSCILCLTLSCARQLLTAIA